MARPLIALGLVCCLLAGRTSLAEPPQNAPSRWEKDIQKFEAADRAAPPPADGILFVGSSSIRMWDVKKSFPDLPVINRGFGGSRVADSLQFADRIIVPYRPRVIVIYTGDNDLAGGAAPQQVAADYRALAAKIRGALPETKIVYIAIKPCIARWKLIDKVRQANALIREATEGDSLQTFLDIEPSMLDADGQPRADLLLADGLHLNAAGYAIWTDLLRPHLLPAGATSR